MPWVRFADDYLSNPKVLSLGPMPRLLDIAGIIYSARELRDGHLSRADVIAVAAQVGIIRWIAPAAALVDVGRWHACVDGSYDIHDYLEYQPSRDEVLAKRAARAAAGAAGGRASAQAKAAANAQANGQAKFNDSRTPYPVPVSPDPDPEPPRTPPDEQGGRQAARRRRRVVEPEFGAVEIAPEDELACAEHARHYEPKCPNCLGAVRAYLDAKRQRNGVLA